MGRLTWGGEWDQPGQHRLAPQIYISDFAGADPRSPIGMGALTLGGLGCNQPQPCSGYGAGWLTSLSQHGLGWGRLLLRKGYLKIRHGTNCILILTCKAHL